MNWIRIVLVAAFCVSAGQAAGIRGVTRRTPTVVYGQTASQFFAAGGLPLNAPTNVGTIPGSPANGGGALAGRPGTGAAAPNAAGRPQPPGLPGTPAKAPASTSTARPNR